MANETIHVKGPFTYEEYVAAAVVKPGQLVALNSAGKIILHATEGGYAERMVVLEDYNQGGTYRDSYAIGDVVPVGIFGRGATAQVLLSAGEDIAIGDELVSAGDGDFIEDTSASSFDDVICYAVAASDLSGTGAVDTLVKARFK